MNAPRRPSQQEAVHLLAAANAIRWRHTSIRTLTTDRLEGQQQQRGAGKCVPAGADFRTGQLDNEIESCWLRQRSFAVIGTKRRSTAVLRDVRSLVCMPFRTSHPGDAVTRTVTATCRERTQLLRLYTVQILITGWCIAIHQRDSSAVIVKVLSNSWDGRPFGHNRHGPTMWAVPPFFAGRGAGSPSKTMSPGPRPICIPSFILIHPAFGHNTPMSQTGQDNGTIA